ncbi:ABC transporter substrate-binding protein [Geodermatophilus sp. DSM 44513]|uniref:ABC transporter substrate-binding protein n=1 Tax=Geodermatophilus sp. DSM 44513 TaxID=1528104 RepID=UPI0028F6EF04|nr:ABC transporter substrate-binding protein [Geodermatophilus sp. DSM 44513]WNV77855.1 ABC transporter substrate-binding protein [Geodermatophilus sp. DSM 44513]
MTVLDRCLPPAPMPLSDDVTRRRFIQGVGAVGLTWVLAGCGGATPVAGEQAPAEGDTVTVDNRFGSFQVPREPQRVVGWEGRRDLETALALGLTPIAVGSNALGDDRQPAPFVPVDLTGVEVIEQTEPDLELIATLTPDLILTRDSNIEELLDRIRTLAPLVPVGGDGPWRPELESIAAALRREEQLSGPLGEYDRRRAEIQQRHADRIDSAVLAVVQYQEGTFYSSATDGFYLQANTLADLGGTHLPFLEEGGEAFTGDGFSAERTSELAGADAIVLITNTPDERSLLDASPLWQQLPAVAAGRVVESDFRTNYGSVYAAGACLDLLDRTYATLA